MVSAQVQALRREAARQGLALMKSRRRDPTYFDYDRYMLRDIRTGRIVLGTPAVLGERANGSATLAQVEAFLRCGRRP
ncbi:MAG: hypothetical protein NVSMB48_05550 [Marmoricola sp.]